MSPEYISSELFHFVGRSAPSDHERNFALLKTILQSGCISHPPHELGQGSVGYRLDLSKSLARGELLVPTVTCYCDIPHPLLRPHLAKYGHFGVSFSRHLLTKVGARPVIYVPCRPDDWLGVHTGHSTLKEIEATFRGIHARNRAIEQQASIRGEGVKLNTVPTSNEDALRKAEHLLALRIIAFVKPFESTLEDSDPLYYYSEREWRKHGNLVFEPQDIVRVVVDSAFLDRAHDELPSFRDRISPAPAFSAG